MKNFSLFFRKRVDKYNIWVYTYIKLKVRRYKDMMTLEPKGKGHFEVEFEDEQNGIAIYDKTLTQAIELLAMVKKEVKSITWKEDK